jgi:hypothetical protein
MSDQILTEAALKAQGWHPVAETPPEGVLLEVLTPGGDQRNLIFEDNLWWLPSKKMYVYFVPTYWRKAWY